MNVLCGVGILSTPYAAKEGGWIGLSILIVFAVLSYYTGLLLRYCLDSQPGLETYPDIGQAAFGTLGRIAISVSYSPMLISMKVNLKNYDRTLDPRNICFLHHERKTWIGLWHRFLFLCVVFVSADCSLRGVICKYSWLVQWLLLVIFNFFSCL